MYELQFKYDINADDPQKIANEMKESLNLPDEKILAIKKQLEKLIADTMSKKEETKVGEVKQPPSDPLPPVEEEQEQPMPQIKDVLENQENQEAPLSLDKTKSNRSLHEVSKGMMLQPNANKTVNYEIYTGKSNDRFDCP